MYVYMYVICLLSCSLAKVWITYCDNDLDLNFEICLDDVNNIYVAFE